MLPQKSFMHATNFLFIIVFLYSFAFSYEQVCDPRDESSLLAFSANLSAPSFSPLNWSSSINCCQWEGVDCDANGRVVGLQLHSRGLKGFIGVAIGDLVSLTHLNLSFNDLHGSLDEGIFELINLRTIDISINRISGSISQKIGNLLFLEKLHLQYNNLSGPIPTSLMRCTLLNEIILGNNHLEGDISKLDFSKLVHLQKLDLLNNTLNGVVPESIYSCKLLIAIRFAANNLTGQISPKIAELKYLSYVSLTQNSFTNITITLRTFSKCRNLTTLFLGRNFYGESLPSNIDLFGSNGFPRLEQFSLDFCNLTGLFPEWLSNIKTIRALGLSKNKFVGEIPKTMGSLPNLFSLDISSSLLSGEIPQELCRLPALMSKVDPKLNNFNIEFPFYALSHTGFKQFNTFPASLILSNNNLSGRIPSEIGKLQGLQRISFGNNSFSGSIPASISNLTNLELLDILRNNLTGEIPASLKSLYFLARLDVSYNDLEGPIPTGFQFDTFEEKAFEGNPKLCGEVIHRSCTEDNTHSLGPLETGHGKRHTFLQGLYVGIASGFSGILVIVASCVWFKTYMQCSFTRRQQSNSVDFTCSG